MLNSSSLFSTALILPLEQHSLYTDYVQSILLRWEKEGNDMQVLYGHLVGEARGAVLHSCQTRGV